jgi:hypothetical protein
MCESCTVFARGKGRKKERKSEKEREEEGERGTKSCF